jgi:hypothetical protein
MLIAGVGLLIEERGHPFARERVVFDAQQSELPHRHRTARRRDTARTSRRQKYAEGWALVRGFGNAQLAALIPALTCRAKPATMKSAATPSRR